MNALQRLAVKIAQAHELGFLPEEWQILAQTALAEANDEWLPEREFRIRTGSSAKWCRTNFERCQAAGLARREAKGHREWHTHARIPRRSPSDVESLKREIVDSYQGAS